MRQQADARLEEALSAGRMRDPRPFYRERLRLLKERDREAFDEAFRYFEEELTPRVADPESDPVAAWLEYGLVLARLSGAGKVIEIDPEGRARPHEPPVRPGQMVLHLPDDDRAPVLVVNLPPEPSPAQQATHRLLVERKLR